jgi:hypothetical protein
VSDVMDPLGFEAGKETFHGCVVVTVTNVAHTSHDLILSQEGLVVPGSPVHERSVVRQPEGEKEAHDGRR